MKMLCESSGFPTGSEQRVEQGDLGIGAPRETGGGRPRDTSGAGNPLHCHYSRVILLFSMFSAAANATFAYFIYPNSFLVMT